MSQDNQLFRHSIHQKILDKHQDVQAWFNDKLKKQQQHIAFYASFDIRDSHFKMACVDANMFPAGFNNICTEDQHLATTLIKDYLDKRYPLVKKILLLTEEHTRNLYYWDNIFVIKSLIQKSGRQVEVCVPGHKITQAQDILTASGKTVQLRILSQCSGDLIISNNDFSTEQKLPTHINCDPPLKMGWFTRKKHHFFKEYNILAKEFANVLQVDSWHFTIDTELFTQYDLRSQDRLQALKALSSKMLTRLKAVHKQQNISQDPYLYLKNNSGTYGLAVMNILCVDDLDKLNSKDKKKMRATRLQNGVSEIILQEGIPTSVYQNQQSAEPVIYTLGSQVTGGFLRSHKEKDNKSNLNSPGAVFRRLCIRDLEVRVSGMVMENVYSWLARLGVLALSKEIENLE